VKRVRRSLANILAIAIALLGILAVAVPSHTQTAPAGDKAAIVEEIKEYAKVDLDNNADINNGVKVVVDLYRDNKAGLTPRQIAKIYRDEYARLKKEKAADWWEIVNPNGIPVLLIIPLLIVSLLWKTFQNGAESLINAIWRWIYNRFAGTRLFHNISLNRYREALLEKYGKLHVPFRPDRPLQMREVYVPLKVAGASDAEQINADEAVGKYRKLMVIGPPGSGKSMLLKHVALRSAEERWLDLPERQIAIFVEMHRLSDAQKSLKQHLVEALARDHFPNAERFVSQGLERGKLMLLLDGLDEVDSNERPRVVQEARDLLDYLDEHRCRVIITCRTAIYEGQFDERVDRTLEVVEFNDWQIRQFLKPWASSMQDNKSIEQLMQMLHDRPLIMALARNPLLLTIIAYLYTDTPFILPHSRAQFYQKATDILLDLWHREQNHYPAQDKRSVLRHLAIYFQDNANRQQQDRRSVNYRQVLAQVKEVLADLNLDSDQTKPLLKEIVERSGLLLEIDGGERYQFAHLTLQEFFAAAELRENGNDLVQYFQKDPDAWRETAKLWCGLATDSTTVIRSIYAQDPITAFECLAGAQKVQQALATEIIDSFKERLSEEGLSADDPDDQIIRAFAAVAADNRPRGRDAFQFLEETLIADRNPARRVAAAKALSLTNLPDAARVLANHYNERSEVREHLVRMGDLAVPVLADLSAQGSERSERAMDGLLAIGTPDAANALVPFLWNADKNLAVRAAWCLAGLLPQPNVEEVLRNYPIVEEQRRTNPIEWIWQPFEEPADSALPVIAGRIAYFIAKSPANAPPGFEYQLKLDERIVIPLCAIQMVRDINLKDTKLIKEKLDKLEKINDPSADVSRQTELVSEALNTIEASPRWRYLVNGLSLSLQIDLLRRLMRGRSTERSDWVDLFRPAKYVAKKSWEFWVAIVLAASLSVIAGIQAYSSGLQLVINIGVDLSIIYFLLVVNNGVLFWIVFRQEQAAERLGIILSWICFSPVFSLLSLGGFSVEKVGGFGKILLALISLVLLLPFVFFTPLVIYLVTVSLEGVWKWSDGVGVWLTLVGVFTTLLTIGLRRYHKARNPLQGILEQTTVGATLRRKLNKSLFRLLTFR